MYKCQYVFSYLCKIFCAIFVAVYVQSDSHDCKMNLNNLVNPIDIICYFGPYTGTIFFGTTESPTGDAI